MVPSPRNKIAEFLSSIRAINTEDGQRALVYSAALDEELERQILFGRAPIVFYQLLVCALTCYGKLRSGQDALEAVLQAARGFVGVDRQEYCDTLLQEWHIYCAEIIPGQVTDQHDAGNLEETDYKYDVFLSYTREFSAPWVDRYFLPLFRWLLQDSLGRDPEVYSVDHETPRNDDSPLYLREVLARSRCLVPVWSPSYFGSSWCRYECIAMIHREYEAGFRTPQNPNGLILPVVASDGRGFPDYAHDLALQFNCRDFVIPARRFDDTERYMDFRDQMTSWIRHVATAIEQAPPWRKDWLYLDFSVPENPKPTCTIPRL